ncbi:hypothetical protein C9R18_26410, partial [Salmonella enterica subsp. enterica serovar Enteritidis]|nr:hypothetical protein [Salmonella enterica subsp. enterica serovar Enteritidis]
AAGFLKASDAEPLTTFEKTFIVAESFPGWDERPFPCRNIAYLFRADRPIAALLRAGLVL